MTTHITIFPPPDLSLYIKSILIETTHPRENVSPFVVLPSPNIVLGFQYRGQLNQIHEQGYKKLNQSGVSGLQTNYRVFQGTNETRSIILTFHPWGASAFLQKPLHEFTNQALSLNEIVGQTALNTLEEQLEAAKTYDTLSELIIDFLRKKIQTRKLKHDLVTSKKLITLIQHHSGGITISDLVSFSGFSERTLERHFKEWIGLTPKKFCALTRLHAILPLLEQGQPVENILSQFNYYDQSHFINDFKSYTGKTPTQWQMSDFSNT